MDGLDVWLWRMERYLVIQRKTNGSRITRPRSTAVFKEERVHVHQCPFIDMHWSSYRTEYQRAHVKKHHIYGGLVRPMIIQNPLPRMEFLPFPSGGARSAT